MVGMWLFSITSSGALFSLGDAALEWHSGLPLAAFELRLINYSIESRNRRIYATKSVHSGFLTLRSVLQASVSSCRTTTRIEEKATFCVLEEA
jgi:hypothetical protein